jgi:hypothetical protein
MPLVNCDKDYQIIRLNVGGKRFSTTLSTLRCEQIARDDRMPSVPVGWSGPHSENVLVRMVELEMEGKMESLHDADGYFFVDRSGGVFEFVMEFLRTGDIISVPHRGISKSRLIRELAYYQILQEDISRGCFSPTHQNTQSTQMNQTNQTTQMNTMNQNQTQTIQVSHTFSTNGGTLHGTISRFRPRSSGSFRLSSAGPISPNSLQSIFTPPSSSLNSTIVPSTSLQQTASTVSSASTSAPSRPPPLLPSISSSLLTATFPLSSIDPNVFTNPRPTTISPPDPTNPTPQPISPLRNTRGPASPPTTFPSSPPPSSLDGFLPSLSNFKSVRMTRMRIENQMREYRRLAEEFWDEVAEITWSAIETFVTHSNSPSRCPYHRLAYEDTRVNLPSKMGPLQQQAIVEVIERETRLKVLRWGFRTTTERVTDLSSLSRSFCVEIEVSISAYDENCGSPAEAIYDLLEKSSRANDWTSMTSLGAPRRMLATYKPNFS